MKIEWEINKLSYKVSDFISHLELEQNKADLHRINLFRAKVEILYLALKENFPVDE